MILHNRYEYNPQTDRLGKGGFGVVYKAHDQLTNQDVALKFVEKSKLPERYSLAEELNRVKKLSHPYLVKYYDVFTKKYQNVTGEMDEMQVGVMEYINGGDLGAFMKLASSKSSRKIYPIMQAILEGLDYLHRQKIIHRDIKPQNILLQLRDGKIIPKIADFSISKQMSTELTSVSAAVGTYEYMSPEQLGKVDAKLGVSTDIWSFGVLAYQLLTGELPFGSRRKGDSDGRIIANIIDPSTKPNVRTLPVPYDQLVEKCLEKVPNQRFHSVREILQILGYEKNEIAPNLEIAPALEEEIVEQTSYQEEIDKKLNTQTSIPVIPKKNPLPISSDIPVVKKSFRNKHPARITLIILLILAGLTGVFYILNNSPKKNSYTQNDKKTDSTNQGKEEIGGDHQTTETTENQTFNDTPPLNSSRPSENTSYTSTWEEENLPEEKENEDSVSSHSTSHKNEPGQPSSPLPVKYEYEERGTLGKIVMYRNKYGFIDNNGNKLIALKYDDFAYFQEGLAAVKLHGKWGYINLRGHLVIPHKFDVMGNFVGGKAEVTYKGRNIYINKKGKCVEGCF